jgi:hypothetical protein
MKASHPFLVVLTALCLLPMAARGAPQEHPAGDAGLPHVTIQASKQLRHQVDDFVSAVVTRPPSRESLMRWNSPVCPLVAGLKKEQGEYILSRISQAARDAHAPLAGEHCQANLFVIVTADPKQILKDWFARRPRLDTNHGVEAVKNFLDSPQPVRVWYNAMAGCNGAAPSAAATAPAELNTTLGGHVESGGATGSAVPGTGLGPVACDNTLDTHLTFGEVQSIFAALVVADVNKLNHVSLAQLADYASLVGLMNIRSDADAGQAPTILRLFHDAKPPDGLTSWDEALLYSVYNTNQSGILQLTDMETLMVRRISP